MENHTETFSESKRFITSVYEWIALNEKDVYIGQAESTAENLGCLDRPVACHGFHSQRDEPETQGAYD